MLIRNKLILRFTLLVLAIQLSLSAFVYYFHAAAREQHFARRLAGKAMMTARLHLSSLLAPLLNRSALRAGYGRAAAEQRAAYWNYQKVIQTGFEEVSTNLRGLENYRRVADLRQQEVAALTQAVSVSNGLYRASYANYLEVVTAQRSVLDAELSLTEARRQQFLFLIDLYRALGGGWTAAPEVRP